MQSEQFRLHAEIEQRHWWFVARRRIIRRVVGELLPTDRRSVIVDVGCGTAANLAALAARHDCAGVDTSVEAIALARERYPNLKLLASPSPQAMTRLLGAADLVMLLDVLEHVPDDYLLLSQVLADMQPGAHLLITVPADETLWSEHDVSFGHFRRYDADRLTELWAGLPVERRLLSPMNARLLPVIRWIRRRNRGRGSAAGEAGTDFWIPPQPLNLLLERAFAGEGRRLTRLLRGRTTHAYPAGTSLMAVLQRGHGPIAPREKPGDAPPDHPQAPRPTGIGEG